MTFKIIIPARLKSTRLPDKPLADICGKPMVVRTWERAVAAVGQENVIVAVDNTAVAAVVKEAGGRAVMTSADHVSGTDRCAEVASNQDWDDDTIIVNLQGDEPLMLSSLIQCVGQTLQDHPGADMATIATPIRRSDDAYSKDVVKVVTSASGRALYFSRATIPFVREADLSSVNLKHYLRHLGLYAYRKSALLRFAQLKPSRAEQMEMLEQLRALDHEMIIQVAVTGEIPHHGVDTQHMLDSVRIAYQKSQNTGQ